MGYRRNYISEILDNKNEIDFLEIIADWYINCDFQKDNFIKEEFDLLNKHFTLIPHGLELSVGSAEGVDQEYLERFKNVIELASSPWWSEHICFTKANGIKLGHLGELPFSEETLKVIRKNLRTVSSKIDTPLILENISYTIAMKTNRMCESEFVKSILEENNCGLLLDVTNLYGNSLNHGYDPFKYLDTLPLERVVQLHFVGGAFTTGGKYIDSHSYDTPEDIWFLLDEVVSRTPNLKGIILERDDNFPEINVLLEELARAREIGRRHKRWT
jgi:uncharacterized protein (UPF0276 family)